MILATDRVHLRPLAADDADELHALWTDVDVRRYVFDGIALSLEQTTSLIAENVGLFGTDGRGLWVARDRIDHSMVGIAGFWFFRDPPELELLYAVERSRWGQGFATEIARAIAEYALSTLGLESIRASTDAANTASSRVLEKLGFELQRRATVGGLDTLFFQLEGEVVRGWLSQAEPS